MKTHQRFPVSEPSSGQSGNTDQNNHGPTKSAERKFVGAGMIFGLALGLAFGSAVDNLGAGIAIGLCFGTGIGVALGRDSA